MNSVKLWDTKLTYKNQLHFYTPTMNYLKRKLRNNHIFNSLKKIKYIEINLTKEAKSHTLETIKPL